MERLRTSVEGLADEEIDLRCAAAVALSSIGSDKSREALAQGANSRIKKLKDICLRGLQLDDDKGGPA